MVFLFSGDRKRVVMTGFGPFGSGESKITKNPSWEGVSTMKGREIENNYDLTLFRKQIAVTYNEVDRIAPQLWFYYEPHVSTTEQFTLSFLIK